MFTHIFTLNVFCSVIEKGSIVKASEELFLTQPAVSMQIKNLENLYNTRFFDRTPRGLKVNQHGKILYGYAKKLIELHDEMHHVILQHTGKDVQDELNIAASTVPGIYFLPKILRCFKEKYSVNFHFEVAETNRILEEMLRKKIDIAVVSHTIKAEGIQYERLFRHPLFVVTPKGHPKTGNQQVRLKDLRGEDLIWMKEDCDITKAWKGFLERHHVSLDDFRITGVFDHISAIIGFLKEGGGISILPECMAAQAINSGLFDRIRLKERVPCICFSLAFRPASLKNTKVYLFYKFLKSYPFSSIQF
jgi:LysR family transcriptional regulator, transcriptional activator of the cysJI operon